MDTNKELVLAKKHLELNAKMVSFAGWNMPIQYDSIMEEHKNTRTNVSVFDISHMGKIIVKGEEASRFLNFITTNDILKLVNGKAQYSAMLYENGFFVDDIVVYKIEETEYLLCVNAANTEKDLEWLKTNAKNYSVEIKDISTKTSMLAIQGPMSIKVIKEIVDFDPESIKYYEFKKTTIKNVKCIIARMGYTGEDGFEIFMPNEDVAFFWDSIFNAGSRFGIKAAGLGARDSLRIEAGFILYGSDIGNKNTPVEAGLNWIVCYDKDFIGKEKLLEQKKNGIQKKLVYFKLEDKRIAREHYKVLDIDNNIIGEVTSGSISPTKNVGIGFAYINFENSKHDSKILIEIRDKKIEASIISKSIFKKE